MSLRKRLNRSIQPTSNITFLFFCAAVFDICDKGFCSCFYSFGFLLGSLRSLIWIDTGDLLFPSLLSVDVITRCRLEKMDDRIERLKPFR